MDISTEIDYLNAVAFDDTITADDRRQAHMDLADLHLKAEGGRLSPRSSALASWAAAAALGSALGRLNRGLYFANLYFHLPSSAEQQSYAGLAMQELAGITKKDYGLPQAAFYIGLLAEDFARKISATGLSNATADGYYKHAANHYMIAAGSLRSDEQMYPQRAANALAALFRHGHGVEQDASHAVLLLERAAAGGFAEAQVNLAGMLIRGEGVTRDVEKATDWLMAAQVAMHKDHPAFGAWIGLVDTITQLAAEPTRPGQPVKTPGELAP